MEDLTEQLHNWFYDEYLLDFTDDLRDDDKDEVEERWFCWVDIIELVTRSDYFELLFRFIEQIANVDVEVNNVEVTRRKVIIEYGQRGSH